MCPDHGFAEQIGLAVKRDRLGAGHLKVELKVILQVRADARAVCAHFNPELFQLLCRADARQLEQLNRIDRAARQDDFACGAKLIQLAIALIFNANSACAFKQDPRRQCLFNDPQVGPLARLIQIGLGRRTARAVPHRHIHPAKAFLGIAIIVFGQAITCLLRRFEPCVMQGIVERAIAGRQRTIAAPIFVTAFGPAFGAFEIGQHIGIAPAGGAFLFLPAFEIERIAAHIDKAVDGRGAAQTLAAWAVQAAAVEMRLRLAFIAPVPALCVHGIGERGGHLDEDGPVTAAKFQQYHLVLAIRAQPVGQHTARRSCADDDVIGSLNRGHRSSPSRHRRSSAGYNAQSPRARFRGRAPTACCRQRAFQLA